jgi:uncharacterized membrane protein YfcA
MDWSLVIVGVGCFLAGFVNAAFATGGVFVVMATLTLVFPPSVAIPLMGPTSAGSLVGRIVLFWRDIDWRIALMFVLGSAIGVAVGVSVFFALPESGLRLGLGVLLLLLIWVPPSLWLGKRQVPFFGVGAVHTFLGTTLGLGGLLQAVLINAPITRATLTGTLALCMFSADLMKVVGFGSLGFDFRPYVPHIIIATVVGFAGAWTGKRASRWVSDRAFRLVFKALVTVVALRLIFQAFATWT